MLSRTLPVLAVRLILSTKCVNSTARLPHRSIFPPLRRMLSTPPPQVNASNLAMDRYHILSDATMDSLLESLEVLLDDLANPDYEVEYHSGVLTLLLGDKGTYVINKQPPNKQIWLSSPFSGPKRYDYSETNDDWLYSRDNEALGHLLNKELTAALGQPVDIALQGPGSQSR